MLSGIGSSRRCHTSTAAVFYSAPVSDFYHHFLFFFPWFRSVLNRYLLSARGTISVRDCETLSALFVGMQVTNAIIVVKLCDGEARLTARILVSLQTDRWWWRGRPARGGPKRAKEMAAINAEMNESRRRIGT